MVSSIDSVSESIRELLVKLSEEQQNSFLDDKAAFMQRQINDSPALDQLCWVRLIRVLLAETLARDLARYTERLESRMSMPGGWRESRTIKSSAEFESPMPWLHPYKLAGEALQPLEEKLETAATSGENQEVDLTKLGKVLEKYDIRLPLAESFYKPKFQPRSLRIYK